MICKWCIVVISPADLDLVAEVGERLPSNSSEILVWEVFCTVMKHWYDM